MRLPFGSESKLGWVIKLGTQCRLSGRSLGLCLGLGLGLGLGVRQRLGHILLNTLRTGRVQQVLQSRAETRAVVSK